MCIYIFKELLDIVCFPLCFIVFFMTQKLVQGMPENSSSVDKEVTT